jgi:hypothetical protein
LWDEQQVKIQEMISSCMETEGFDYAPDVIDGSMLLVEDTAPQSTPDRGWVAQFGWGIITNPKTGRPNGEGVDSPEYIDPNASYVASLSNAAARAYYQALFGPDAVVTDGVYQGVSAEVYAWERGGCSGLAYHTFMGEDPTSNSEFDPLFGAISEMYSDLYNDPTIRSLEDSWSQCMADRGYPGYSQRIDARADFNSRILMPAVLGAAEHPAGVSVYALPEAQALIDTEITMALADYDCAAEVNYDDQYSRVTYAAQEQFITDHRAELDAYKLAAEQWPW